MITINFIIQFRIVRELLLGILPCGGAVIGRMVVCLGSGLTMLGGELVDNLVTSVGVPALWKVLKVIERKILRN